MAVRKVWVGSIGPFLYDDSNVVTDEDGNIVGNQRALLTDGEIEGVINASRMTDGDSLELSYAPSNYRVADQKLASHLEGIDNELSDYETRLGNAEQSITDHETRLGNIEQSITDHNTRLNNVEQSVADHETRLSNVEQSITNHENRISDIEGWLAAGWNGTFQTGDGRTASVQKGFIIDIA